MAIGVLLQQSRSCALPELTPFRWVAEERVVYVDGLLGVAHNQHFSFGLEPLLDAQIRVADHGAAEGGELERASRRRGVDTGVRLAGDEQVDAAARAVLLELAEA